LVTDSFDDSSDCSGECSGLCDPDASGANVYYVVCNCNPADTCGWAENGVCDDACTTNTIVTEMFDDSVDCAK
jgi:hypothetical protein